MTTQTARHSQQTNTVAPWVCRGGPAVAAMALVTYVTAYAHWPTLRLQVDAMVYRFAAERLLAGLDLYSTGLTGKPGELLFIYPPFAAICALPLALLDSFAVQLLWLPGAYVFVFLAVVLGTAVWLWRLPDCGRLTGLSTHDLHDVERAHAERDSRIALAQQD